MGCDPMAFLYYGIELGEDEPECAGCEDYYDANAKWQDSEGPKEPADNRDGTYKGSAWDKWRKALEDYEHGPRHIRIELSGSEHGYNYFVCAAALTKSVEWSEQLSLGGVGGPLGDLMVNHLAERQAIADFCCRFGLTNVRPTWHLACRYF